MSDVTLNATFGPRYEIVIQQETVEIGDGFELSLNVQEPLRLGVGTGFNSAGSQTKTGTLDVTITAQEVINAFRAVGYDGRKTELTVASLSNYAGVSRMATIIGDPIDVVRVGLMEESGWNWTVNQPIFISHQGVLTQTPVPGVIRRIGWAISPTQINLDPYPIIGV